MLPGTPNCSARTHAASCRQYTPNSKFWNQREALRVFALRFPAFFTAALAPRIARASSPVRSRMEFATLLHWRLRFGDLARCVLLCASFAVHGIAVYLRDAFSHSIMPSSQSLRLSECNLAALVQIARPSALSLPDLENKSRMLRLILTNPASI